MLVGDLEGYRHLDRVLRNAAWWADDFAIVCDNSDDDTFDACLGRTDNVQRVGISMMAQDESRARNTVMAMLDTVAKDGDIIVVLDADEELLTNTKTFPRMVLPSVALDAAGKSDRHAWPCLFVHHWDPLGRTARMDGGWAPGYATRIYRHEQGRRIQQREFACSPIPESALIHVCPVEESPFVVRHWGYAYPHDRLRKQRYYQRRDGGRFHSARHLASITEEPTLVNWMEAVNGVDQQ